MSYTEKQNSEISAEKILSDFLLNTEVSLIRETLTELFYQWIRSDMDYSQSEREHTLLHYQYILELLDNAEAFQKERRGEV